jgi:hypothetical protein
MELYRIYLRAYVTASGNLKVNIEGAGVEELAACALAVNDVRRGEFPRPFASVGILVEGMCKEGPSCV